LTKVAVVTGGTRGIGLAITKTLKAQGYAVAAVYAGNEAAAEAARKDLGVMCIKADVGDFEAVGAAFANDAMAKIVRPVPVLNKPKDHAASEADRNEHMVGGGLLAHLSKPTPAPSSAPSSSSGTERTAVGQA
jgi:uncharacterized protein YbjT (DUF2867 family)